MNALGVLLHLGWLASAGAELPPNPNLLTLREGAITRGPVQRPRLALVFTGHEFAESAGPILDALEQRKLRGSFFLTGAFLDRPDHAALIQRMIRGGHYIGPHSDAHLLYCAWTPGRELLVHRAAFFSDLRRNQEKIARFLQAEHATDRPRYFLPPYEHFNAQIAEWTRDAGLTLINHTPGTRSHADYTEDAASNFTSSETILASIRDQLDRPQGLNGFILLLHLGAGPKRTDKFHTRFPELLDLLRAKSYQPVRIDELLDPVLGSLGGPIHVRVNQVGYRGEDAKHALAFAETPLPDAFTLLDADTGREVMRGQVRALAGETWGRFPHHGELDFSIITRPGRYVIQIGPARSHPFTIGAAYRNLPDDGLEFMRQQRCGYNPWLRAECHTQDGRTAFGALPAGTPIDARGGWHDAGDLLKYLLTSGNATAQMLLAWELCGDKSALADRVNARGDPGPNGIPDLLDEARWGLDWLLKLHPDARQLYHQVADDRDHSRLRLPQDEIVDYGWGKGGPRVVYAAEGRPQGLKQYQSESTGMANLAGRHAAALALAWQVWHADPRQRAFAELCLAKAKSVYELGRAHEGVQQGNSYGAPYRYEETTWADDMEWGAAELFRATRDPRYRDEAIRYARLAGSESWMGREQTRHYQFYPTMNLGHFRLHDLVDAPVRRELEAFYREGLERCARASQGNPYRVGVPFIWCSANLSVALATQGLLYERMTGDRSFREFTLRQRDWLLGRNPWGTTFLTEVGTVFPTEVHLQTTRLTGRRVRGGLIDGPVYERIFKSLRGVSITEPDPLAAFQDARAVYHNDWHDYATNEPIMDGTAAAILLWSLSLGP